MTRTAAWTLALGVGVALLALTLTLPLLDNRMLPPVAATHPHSVTLHGDTRVDDYFWLRQKGAPEVTAYLEAENAYADRVMEPTRALQDTLYDEILRRIQE